MTGNSYQTNADEAEPVKGDQAEADVQPQEPPANRQRKRSPYGQQVFRANIVLIGVFVAGAATVYGLTFRNSPAKASAEQRVVESQVEAMIMRLASAAAKGDARRPGRVTNDLLKNFYDQITERQIPLRGLRKNPFHFVGPRLRLTRPASGTPQRPQAKQAREDPEKLTEEKAAVELGKLHLQSVMMGRSGSTAIISNNLLTVGQKIKCFTVKRIDSDSVVLEWGGRRYVLSM